MMYCSNCGSQIDNDSMFCGECGAKIGSAPVQPAYQQPYQQPAAPPPWQQYPQYPNRRKGISKSWFVAGGIGILVLVICVFVFRPGNSSGGSAFGLVGEPAAPIEYVDYSALSPTEQKALREDLYQRVDKVLVPIWEGEYDDLSMILGIGASVLQGESFEVAMVKKFIERFSGEMDEAYQQWISDNNLDSNTVNKSIEDYIPEYVSHVMEILF